MNSINDKEIEILTSWIEDTFSEQVRDSIFTPISKESASYWSAFDNSNNCTEYNFDSVPSLRDNLKNYFPEEAQLEIVTPLSVAIYKNKYCKPNNDDAPLKETSLEIPEFVYVF